MPPRRREAQLMDRDKRRDVLLSGITDRTAVQLYDEGMAQLEELEQATYAAAMMLRDACQWTVVINEIQTALQAACRAAEPDEKRIAQMIRHKQSAEDARRQILSALMLTPQRPRGRPPKPGAPAPAREADDGWDDFGKTVSADGFGEGDDAP